MKFKTFQIIALFGEVLSFVLAGIHFANKNYGFALISYLLGSIIAVYLGKQIEKNAIKKYKEEKK